MKFARPGVLLLLVLACRLTIGQTLPGFTLAGENWTYDPGDGGAAITGILSRPSTSSPLPAVLISHGKGGNAIGFSLQKARVMTNWGLVCIGPNYTHAGSGSTPEDEGYSPENSRRARACFTILRSLPYVDTNRLAAYGNSMGAFLTAGLCGEARSPLHAAAITAGGTSGTSSTDFASPAVQEVQGIVAPFLMLHGTVDTTVPPAQSATLQSILASNGIPNSRVLFDGVGHNLHSDRSTEVYALMRDWFTQWGVLASTNSPAPTNAAATRPRGLFVLDSSSGRTINGVSMRDANLRTNAPVSGYVLRAAWETLEPAQGVYDFTLISNLLALLPTGQSLSLILTPQDPAYIAAAPGATTWLDQDRNGNPLARAVPWDPFLRERRQAFIRALAQAQFGGVAFSNHPSLLMLNPYLPGGHTGIRDPNLVHLRDMSGYSRSNLLSTIQDELRALTGSFPARFVQIGFWPITDNENAAYGGLTAHEYIRQQLLTEFNGVIRPRVGFFMENLAASRPAPGAEPVTGTPNPAWAVDPALSQTNTWVGFQALGSWSQPFNPEHVDNTTNGTPADGIRFGFETYGSTYFELYVTDIDQVAYLEGLGAWQARLTAPLPRLQLLAESPSGVCLCWDRAAAITVVETATNCTGPFLSVARLTNQFAWNTAATGSRSFLRVRQND
jgi:dienelactone hydrolase